MARTKKKPTGHKGGIAPDKIKRPAVWLEGGPWDGRCYYADDLDQLVRAEQAQGRSIGYRPTRRSVVHPGTDGEGTHDVLRVWEPAD